MNITVIDNYLELKDFKKIQELVFSDYFPWFYNNSIIEGNRTDSIYDSQFIHYVIRNNHIVDDYAYQVFNPLIYKLNAESIVRLKLNLNTATHIHYKNGLHVDVPNDNNGIKTGILYINTNNGATVFEDGTEVQCVENRFVVFDVNMKHEAKTSTDTKARYVANVNFLRNASVH